MKKLKIIYSANGDVVSDLKAEKWVDSKIKEYLNSSNNLEIRIGTEYMLNIFVLRVMQDIISMNEVEFYNENILLLFNKYDGIIFPDDCQHFGFATLVMEIVKLGYEHLKADNKELT